MILGCRGGGSRWSCCCGANCPGPGSGTIVTTARRSRIGRSDRSVGGRRGGHRIGKFVGRAHFSGSLRFHPVFAIVSIVIKRIFLLLHSMARRRFQCGWIVFHIFVASRSGLALGEQERTNCCHEQQSKGAEFPKQAERFFHDGRGGNFTLTKNTSLFRNEKDEDESGADTGRTRGKEELLEAIESVSIESAYSAIAGLSGGTRDSAYRLQKRGQTRSEETFAFTPSALLSDNDDAVETFLPYPATEWSAYWVRFCCNASTRI